MSFESRQTFQGMYDQLVGTITIVELPFPLSSA